MQVAATTVFRDTAYGQGPAGFRTGARRGPRRPRIAFAPPFHVRGRGAVPRRVLARWAAPSAGFRRPPSGPPLPGRNRAPPALPRLRSLRGKSPFGETPLFYNIRQKWCLYAAKTRKSGRG